MPFFLVWIVIPYAFDIHGNNLDAVKETAKQYLGQIHRVKPLPINPSKLNRLTHLIVQRNLAEYQELGGKFFIRPTSMATLRKQCPQLYRDIINALASNNSNNSRAILEKKLSKSFCLRLKDWVLKFQSGTNRKD